MGFNLDDYEPVENRIRAFYRDHPEGRINTTLLERDGGMYIVHAAVYRLGEDVPWATGLAQEAREDRGVNKTSPLENCETSAIGRAPGCSHEWEEGRPWTITGTGGAYQSEHSWKPTLEHGRRLMDMPWVQTKAELSEAIPPAYTQHIGEQFLAQQEAA